MRETDASLLAAAKREISKSHKGKTGAFEEILIRYEKLIYYVARRYFTNPDDALDASQEAAVKIYKGLANVNIPEDGNLKAWVCTVTARVCLDVLRKQRPTTIELAEDIIQSTLPSAEETAIANERVQDILAGIKKLPENLRIVIILRDMQGLSYEQLAKALDINIGTVKSRLSRARLGLKNILRSSE